MSIELKITGNHATDLVAQIQMLSEIFAPTVQTELKDNVLVGKVVSPVEICSEPVAKKINLSLPDEKSELPEKLNRKEQDIAVEEMIAAGKKDSRFDLLTKSRQNAVNDGLTVEVMNMEEKVEEAREQEVASEEAAASNVDYMFEDAPKDNTGAPTREDVSMLMAKIAKDKDGAWLNEKALKVRAVLVENIPISKDPKVKTPEPKVRNIPEDKLGIVYAALKEMED